MKEDNNNLEVFNQIVTALSELNTDSQLRTLEAVVIYLDLPFSFKSQGRQIETSAPKSRNEVSFSEDRSISSKDFLREKQPKTDIERVACLAYYLTHYRNMPYFKTVDLSTLNTEAAQQKFSNATLSVNNAATTGLLAPAGKGTKQISSAGEVFVLALPDRDAAKASLSNLRSKRKPKRLIKSKKNS